MGKIAEIFSVCQPRVFFKKLVSRTTFGRRYDHADATVRASEAFAAATDFRSLALAAEEFLGATIGPAWADFFLKDAAAPKGFAPVSEESSAAILDEAYAAMVEGCFRTEGSGASVFDLSEMASGAMGATSDNACRFSVSDLMALGVGAVVPICFRRSVNALLVIGKKKSWNSFSTQDKKLLALVSCQMGVAVEMIRLFDASKRHAEGLERRVAERTRRIRTMHEAQSKFLADLSHEFQTPLTILKMNVEAFAEKSGSERRKSAYVMETTIDRLSRLTRNLVDIAQLNSFREALQGHRVDLAVLLRDACEDCLVLAKDRDIDLSAEGDECFIWGDFDKLKEVMLNLLSNAFKNTAPGGSVALAVRHGEGEAEVTVSDTGKGIPSKNLPLIFERFYRIGDGISEGSGLGLHLCRKIVEAHGGTIIAESSVGRGSRFVIHLPIVEEVESRT